MSDGGGGVKYSLAMIARNCAEDLDRALSSFASYPDEVVVVNTAIDGGEEGFEETKAVALKHGARHLSFPWINDFAKARQFSFDSCENDVVMWLDADDVVENAQQFDSNVRALFETGRANCLIAEYLYEFDELGHCTTRLLRERVVDRRVFEWRAPIHECLCANFRPVYASLPENGKGGYIRHSQRREDKERLVEKLERNLGVFDEHFKGDEPEERMLYYWGNTLMGLERWGEAIAKYEAYLPRTGSPGEKYAALLSAAEASKMMKDFDRAMHYARQAIRESETLPGGHLQAADACFGKEDWQGCLYFARGAMRLFPNLSGEMVTNPKALEGRPYVLAALASAKLGNIQDAQEFLPKALEFFPKEKGLLDLREYLKDADTVQKDLSAFVRVRDLFWEAGLDPVAENLAQYAPSVIRNQPEIHRALPKRRPPDKKSIAFYCEAGAETWGPNSIKDGIGGSEEAVINVSNEFARRGWHVEVYRRADEYELSDTGVHWHPTFEWTGERDSQLDVAVFWRNADVLPKFGVNAKLTYLWLHDMPMTSTLEYGFWNAYDGVMALSDYHRDQYGFVPEEKIFRTANALDESIFVPQDDLTNEPTRLIYCSCPTRGLVSLLERWNEIREHFPDAELDVFYGFTNTYNAMMNSISADENWMRVIKTRVLELVKQPGVNYYGKVSQIDNNRALARAGIWAYPTDFPEISCISAMKAQAHGAWPVCSDKGALVQTVRHGDMVNGPMSDPSRVDAWLEVLLNRMANPPTQEERLAMVHEARSWTWSKVVDGWLEHFEGKMGCSEPKRWKWGDFSRTQRQNLGLPVLSTK